MRIQHNIAAMNAYRNYTSNASAVSKNLEKLSSGYKINRAGDDAAGLAISEKMRAQITGLDTAQSNAKDGISLVQTAEGALTEVHDMLNRMYELSDQSANGTYDNETDRANLQKEITSLSSEINRIADSSNFNGINLLDGSLASSTTASSSGSVVSGVGQLNTTSAVAGQYQSSFKLANAGANIVVADTDLANGGVLKLNLTTTEGNFTINFAIQGADEITGTELAGIFQTALTTPDTDFQSLNPDWADFSSKFTITAATPDTGASVGFTITAKDAGTTAPAVTGASMSIYALDSDGAVAGTASTLGASAADAIFHSAGTAAGSTSTVTAAKDSYAQINFGGSSITNDDLEGKSLSVGGKTYTFAKAADVYSLDKSVVGISLGKDRAETMKNLAAALKANGITSAVADGGNIKVGDSTQVSSAYSISAKGTNISVGTTAADGGGAYKAGQTVSITSGSNAAAGDTVSVNGKTYQFVSDLDTVTSGNVGVMIGDDADATVDNLRAALKTNGIETKKAAISTNPSLVFESDTTAAAQGGLKLQIGDTAEGFNQLTVSVNDMHTKAMGISNIDISTQSGAAAAMASVKSAINYVSSTRGDLGATQNRLEHTINNLAVMQENIQDAESSIRDVDVAKEMMSYTKNNILVQSAQAMLAQANQLPQGVLQLLQ